MAHSTVHRAGCQNERLAQPASVLNGPSAVIWAILYAAELL
jgi:hypothetical protein